MLKTAYPVATRTYDSRPPVTCILLEPLWQTFEDLTAVYHGGLFPDTPGSEFTLVDSHIVLYGAIQLYWFKGVVRSQRDLGR